MKQLLVSLSACLILMMGMPLSAQTYSMNDLVNREWKLFDDVFFDVYDMSIVMTPTQFSTTFNFKESGDQISGGDPFYLSVEKPTVYDPEMVGQATNGKYIVLDTSHTRSDGTVKPGEFMVFEITKLTSTELYLKGESGHTRKYRIKP